MIKAPIGLQDLRRRIYAKAKAEPSWRFWGLYVHVCKMETLQAAYKLAKENNGAPGIDGVTFESVESSGRAEFLEQLREELVSGTYSPQRVRRVGIPKTGGKLRMLSIPTIRDRVVQGALKLILEPIFEADFQPGSFGYRPKRSAHDAVGRVRQGILQRKTRVIDLDLRSYFDNVRHHLLLEKIAVRVDDGAIMGLLKKVLKSSGSRGVPQGGVISPLLSNIYLSEVDRMLERAREVTCHEGWTAIEYVRFADDIVVLVDSHPRHAWLFDAVQKRLREEFDKLQVELNKEKSRVVDLERGECFGFLGFDFRRVRTLKGRWMPLVTPQVKKRTELLRKLKGIFNRSRSQPLHGVIAKINPILRGWVNYFAIGNSSRCFSFIRLWVEKKIRRLLAKARQRDGFGWKRWSSRGLYEGLGLFGEYRVARQPARKASPA
ncbi:MAG: group II intron reverse transcriptase/maturase [bacterium]|nr:group II intron reverse transcriptase/maturase [bacterium]